MLSLPKYILEPTKCYWNEFTRILCDTQLKLKTKKESLTSLALDETVGLYNVTGISTIIPVFGNARSANIISCIKSWEHQAADLNGQCELIVVEPEGPKLLPYYGNATRITVSPKNIQYPLRELRNAGWKATKYSLIEFHDGDVLYPPFWLLAAMYCAKYENSFCGYSEVWQTEMTLADKIKSNPVFVNFGYRDNILELQEGKWCPSDMSNGCGMTVCLHTDIIAAVGGWNENMDGWGADDTELGVRLKNVLGYAPWEKSMPFRVIHLFHPKDSRASLKENREIAQNAKNQPSAYTKVCPIATNSLIITACNENATYVRQLWILLTSLYKHNPTQKIKVYCYNFNGDFLLQYNPNAVVVNVISDYNGHSARDFMCCIRTKLLLDNMESANYLAWFDTDIIVRDSLLPLWESCDADTVTCTYRPTVKNKKRKEYASGLVALHCSCLISALLEKWNNYCSSKPAWWKDQEGLRNSIESLIPNGLKFKPLSRHIHDIFQEDTWHVDSIVWHGKSTERDQRQWKQESLKYRNIALLQSSDQLVDVVYPFLITGSTLSNFEILHALRSLHLNGVNVGKVFIAGTIPTFLTDVLCIKCADTNVINTEANMIRKVLASCFDDRVSDPFLLVNDDHFFIQSMNICKIPPFHKGSLKNRTDTSSYASRINATRSLCEELGLPSYNYDAHIPMLIHKQQYVEALLKVAWDIETVAGILTKSVYGNYIGGGIITPDSKLFSSSTPKGDALFFSTVNEPMVATLNFLMTRFSIPSPWEIPEKIPVFDFSARVLKEARQLPRAKVASQYAAQLEAISRVKRQYHR